jgi:hypothetical protein
MSKHRKKRRARSESSRSPISNSPKRLSSTASRQKAASVVTTARWVIVDLMGKAGHMRTVPIPAWAKAAIDEWKAAT